MCVPPGRRTKPKTYKEWGGTGSPSGVGDFSLGIGSIETSDLKEEMERGTRDKEGDPLPGRPDNLLRDPVDGEEDETHNHSFKKDVHAKTDCILARKEMHAS